MSKELSSSGFQQRRWGMSVDLDRCTGCGACVAACKVENNVPEVSPEEAQGNLEAGLNASGIFRKNISKTEDWGETKQKLDVMPVYFPGLRSNGSPSICCIDETDDGVDDCDPKLCDLPETPDVIELCVGDPGVPYDEWRLGGDPLAEECDPRLLEDPEACQVTLIECRDIASPS